MVTEEINTRVTFTLGEARDDFEDVIARVESGETVAIMREGRTVAEMSPGSEPKAGPEEREAAFQRFWEELRELRRAEPTGITREEILKWRHEGHER